MIQFLLPAFFLSVIRIFNILGVHQDLVVNQLSFAVIGFFAFFVIKKIGRNFFLSNTTFFYWLFVGILIATFIIGLEIKGSRRWIDLYLFNFQASEVFKAFYIL